MTSVKSIAGLRREVEKRKKFYQAATPTQPSDQGTQGVFIAEFQTILDLIDSLEAGLRGRLEELKGYRQHSPVGSQSGAVLAEKIEELRRVLGGGGAE